jgi:transposase
MPDMPLQFLLPDAQQLALDSYQLHWGILTLFLSMTQVEAPCPDCEASSTHVHSCYTRTVADLPCPNCQVRWKLSVRRFYCDNHACTRRTFAEQIPSVVARYARRSQRLRLAQTEIAFALCGEPSAKLARKLHVDTSPDTFLRLVRQMAEVPSRSPRVLGLDDWALRKGRRYGTILIDVERSKPVDLLPDRETKTVVTWLQAHPGIEIVTRDRASAYAEAITQGAPQATQVADRWHLLLNLREAIQRLLDRHQTTLRKIRADSVPTKSAPAPTRRKRQSKEARRREQRLHRYQEIQQLRAEGMSYRAIARRLNLDRRTVQRYAVADALPERASRTVEPNVLTPFYPYLTQRWQASCHNAVQLWREIKARGYPGPRVRVYRWSLKQRRLSPIEETDTVRFRAETGPALTARRAAWLIVRVPSELKEEEYALLRKLLAQCAPLQAAYDLAQAFGTMVRERRAAELMDWIAHAKASGLTELKNFATSLERDFDAVHAGLSLAWSNGPTEDHVNRLKLLKRQMYGRANFDLLRRRVLGAD